MPKDKHSHLLEDDPEVKRWFNNLARGSIITAHERLRRLGRLCEVFHATPKELIQRKRKAPEKFDNLMMDFADESLRNGAKPNAVRNNLITLRSWLSHFGLKIDKKIKLPIEDAVEETVPSSDQLATIFRHCDPRSLVISSLLAFSGLRPESIGNYLGNDGLRLKDLPDLVINTKEGKVEFKSTPAILLVRRTLSKARHQYFSFIPSQGCRYVVEYLESRLRSGEDLNPESPLVSHIRTTASKLEFLRTTKLSWEVKKAIVASGFKMRPYILRSYFETQMMIAESKGKIMRDYRVFFMGHRGDIEHRYSLNKGRLSENVIQDLRESFNRSSEFLETEINASERMDELKQKLALNQHLLFVSGYSQEEIQKLNVESLTDEQVGDYARKRLVGIRGGSESIPNMDLKEEAIPVEQINEYLSRGYHASINLGDGRVIVQPPKFAY